MSPLKQITACSLFITAPEMLDAIIHRLRKIKKFSIGKTLPITNLVFNHKLTLLESECRENSLN